MQKNRILKLSRKNILYGIDTQNPPNVKVLKKIDSTNSLAKRLFLKNRIKNNTIILAKEQTGGRGRCGRSFYSPNSTGLYMTIALTPQKNDTPNLSLTTICAVASAEAIEKLSDKKVQIKWVNDIYIDNKKAGGILCESTPTDSGVGIILGIGINTATSVFPEFENNIPTSVGNIDRNALASEIYNGIMRYMSGESYVQKYKNRSYLDGKRITVHLDNSYFDATVIGIDDNCGLVVRPDGEDKEIILSSGEVIRCITK